MHLTLGFLHVTLKYTYPRGGTIIYQRAVPKSLWQRYPGKTVKHDLKTADLTEAERAVAVLNKRYETEWAGLKAAPNSSPAALTAHADAFLKVRGLRPGVHGNDPLAIELLHDEMDAKRMRHASGDEERYRAATADTAVISRGLPIQWVRGDADKAETSFFKINTKGTPLDQIEELLLKNRHRPVSIAARAVIRAGKGHKYWSGFKSETATAIEEAAKELHSSLFDPEINTPIKTLDLPLGGPKGLRIALQVLIEVILIAIRNQDGRPQTIADLEDDEDGQATLSVLKRTLDLFHRITGNDRGSLGLHPAVYFYGPTGRHSSAMFMGTVTLIAWKLAINDRTFFDRFSKIRARLESLLVEHKDLIATILQKHVSGRRIDRYASLLDQTIDALLADKAVTQDDLIHFAALDGKIVMGSTISAPKKFSDDSKSEVFIQMALSSSVKCPICSGYLDTVKSVSYDHIQRAAEGGPATSKNLQMTHPYCNQSVKG